MGSRSVVGNARLRAIAACVAVVAVELLVTQFLLPGSIGAGRGTPVAVVFRGVVSGFQVAISAVAIVVVYRTLRIVNFASVGIGAVGAVFATLMITLTNVPFLVSFVLAVAVSAVLGALVGVFTLRFFDASRLFLTVVTIIAVQVAFSVVALVVRLPFFPPFNERPAFSPEQFRRLLPFSGWRFQIGDFGLPLGFPEIFALEVSVLTLLAVGAFFRYTRSGVAVRALAENPERASLLGIGVGRLSIIVWTLAGALAGTTAVLSSVSAGSANIAGDPSTGLRLFLPVLAAALIGGMTNLPITVFAAVALGVAQQCFNYSYRTNTELFYVLLFVVLGLALLAHRRRATRSEAGVASSWSATDEPRPMPAELAALTSIRVARVAIVAAVVAAAAVFPFVVGTGRVSLAGFVFVNAIAVLSLVVLTGWAGQVSLGQYAFVAVGAVVGGALTSRAGMSFWLAVPVTAAITAALALVVGLPALRVRGLMLLVTTLAFAVAVQAALFNRAIFGWLLPTQVDRPSLLFVDFEDERSMYFLCLVALALALFVVANLRRSRVGRVLIGVRENEANLQSFGVGAARAKLLAFAISGALCGFAGALLAHQQRAVSAESFSAFASVQVFIQAVLGGVSSGAGALLGSGYYVLVNDLFAGNVAVQAFFSSGGPLLVVFLAPGGLVSLVTKLRDSVLRIVAQRRQLVVPSLFADVDPEALERRLIPLAPPDLSGGLGALPADQRFALESELYAGRGERIVERLGTRRETTEMAAITAAARSVEDGEAATTPEAVR